MSFDRHSLPPKKRFLETYRNSHDSITHQNPSWPATDTDLGHMQSQPEVKEDSPDNSKAKRIKKHEPSSSPTMPSSLFPPVPSLAANHPPKHPLINALERHLKLMNPQGLKIFHYSEILRQIAFFHRANRHSLTKDENDILTVALFLYEKAVTIDPRNIYAASELQTYKEHVKIPFSETQTQARIAKYQTECANMGPVKYFWMSLNKYIERLCGILGDKSNTVLADLCTYLKDSPSIQYMRGKHIDPLNQQTSCTAFTDAVAVLQPLEAISQFSF